MVRVSNQFTVKENVLIVRLRGEIDHHETLALREEWQTYLRENNIHHIILNVEDVTFMDSSGIGVLLGRYNEIAKNGGQFFVCSIHPQIDRLFAMAGLYKIVQTAKDEKSALTMLGVAS
ncbi:MAG TPA: anti-sigma F factor antagonist [Pseudogracilibacillus sp.]|nr:anti-sigma F factor antagonist [Pseudogracilibacillus sp.]